MFPKHQFMLTKCISHFLKFNFIYHLCISYIYPIYVHMRKVIYKSFCILIASFLLTSNQSVASVNDSLSFDLLKKFEYYKYRSIDSCKIIHQRFIEDKDKSRDLSWIDLSMQAELYYMTSNYDSAIVLYDSALVLIDTNKYQFFNNYLLLKVAFSNSLNYNVEKASRYYYTALKGFSDLNDEKGLVLCYIRLGEFYRKIANYTEAIKFLDLANDSLKSNIEKSELKALLLNRYAAVYNETQLSSANTTGLSKEALEIATYFKNYVLMATSYMELGFIEKNNDRFIEANIYLRKASNLYKMIGMKRNYASVLINQAQVAVELQDYKTAHLYLDTCDLVAHGTHWYNLLKQLYTWRIFISKKENNYEAAYKYVIKKHEISQAKYNADQNKEVEKIRHKYEIDTINRKLELEKKEKIYLKRMILLSGLVLAALVILIIIIYYYNIKSKHDREKLRLVSDELKSKNIALNENIKAKNELLREIHHRVNNNLNILSSMVFLQLSMVKDPIAHEILEDYLHRMEVISRVHKQLDSSVNNPKVIIEEFYRGMVNNLLDGMLNSHVENDVIIETDKKEMGIKQAIPLALIINEVITNSIKHALSNPKALKIRFYLKVKDEKVYLELADNGQGIKNLSIINQPKSTGMKIITLFAKQLNSKLDYHYNNGSVFSLIFPLKN